MASEISKFDPATYAEKLREKIRNSLIDIIPDEEWDKMIRSEIASYFAARADPYSNKMLPSPFTDTVRRVFTEDVEGRTRDMLKRPEWTQQWGDRPDGAAGTAIAELMVKHGPEILNSWLANIIQGVVSSMLSRMQR